MRKRIRVWSCACVSRSAVTPPLSPLSEPPRSHPRRDPPAPSRRARHSPPSPPSGSPAAPCPQPGCCRLRSPGGVDRLHPAASKERGDPVEESPSQSVGTLALDCLLLRRDRTVTVYSHGY